jgi:hypothetical protein
LTWWEGCHGQEGKGAIRRQKDSQKICYEEADSTEAHCKEAVRTEAGASALITTVTRTSTKRVDWR